MNWLTVCDDDRGALTIGQSTLERRKGTARPFTGPCVDTSFAALREFATKGLADTVVKQEPRDAWVDTC